MAQQLVNAYATVNSTEGLILFVAGRDHMLNFCQQLLELKDRGEQAPLLQEINSLCRAQAIPPKILYAELRKTLLALNRFHDAGGDHYAVLGLTPGATRDEVKQAFRTLSKQYHPDRMKGGGDQAQRFMEIAGAYHALMAAAATPLPGTQGPWRGHPPPAPGRAPLRQWLFFFGIGGMVCLLAWASLYLAGRYDKFMVIRQLRAGSPAPKPAETREKPAETAVAQQKLPEQPHQQKTPETATNPQEGEQTQAPGAQQPKAGSSWVTPVQPAALEPFFQDNICLNEPGRPQPEKPLPMGRMEKPAAAVRGKAVASAHESGEHPAPADLSRNQGQPPISPATAKKEPATNRPTQTQAAPVPPVISHAKINTLISQYSTLYSRKELTPFLMLFTEKALENGHPLPTITEQYRSLFAHTRAIKLRIVNIQWNQEGNGYHAWGNFRSSYTYNDGRSREHSGDINFLLVDDQGKLKIQALNYVFLE